MISEEFRVWLYPLGFIAHAAFMGRFLVQWIKSEMQQKSVVPILFWYLSLLGNVLLAFHGFVQLQFVLTIVQVCNAVISWRNINLMQQSSKQVQLKTVVILLMSLIAFTTSLFVLQGFLSNSGLTWARTPINQWNSSWAQQPVSPLWHILGTVGIILFSGRFWVQWWNAERNKASVFGQSFWWMSLVGALLSLTYFISLGDVVNVIGPALGMIPYIRNLMLLSKKTSPTQA